MLELLQAIPFCFAALFPVVNPIGSSVLVLSMVNGSSKQALKRLSRMIAIYMSILLITALLLGSWIMRLFGISIPIVLIAGGLILAYIGWQLLNKPLVDLQADVSPTPDQHIYAMAFYPLTMPVTAGPGCIAVAIALGAHALSHSVEETLLSMLGNVIGILLVGLSVFFFYRYAVRITAKLTPSAMQVIMRLAAFLNLCIGAQLMWHGITLLDWGALKFVHH